MNTLIVFCHPWKGSFQRALLDSLLKGLNSAGKSVDVIDLYADGFNPVLEEKELALYSKGGCCDPKVEEYKKRIEAADTLFVFTPIWWSGMPAMLKGFFDKVLLKGWAYDPAPMGMLKGRLTHIKQATVISTMNAPGWYYRFFMGNVLKHELINGCLKTCGIKKVNWLKLASVVQSKPEKRKHWLEKVEDLGKM